MLRPLAQTWAAILAAALAWGAENPSLLQIRLAEGDAAAYPTGSRATRGLTVLITDETGRPVEGATVSFTLPADGPSGVFNSGTRTEIAATRADGRAAAWGMRWNHTAGPFEIRITAVKGQTRAGAVSSQYLSDSPKAKDVASRGGSHHKLLWISLALAGAAAAGAVGIVGGKASNTAATSVAPLQIGTPTITLGHP